MKTLKNKIYAIVLVGIGVAATFLLEEGVGVLIFMLMFASIAILYLSAITGYAKPSIITFVISDCRLLFLF